MNSFKHLVAKNMTIWISGTNSRIPVLNYFKSKSELLIPEVKVWDRPVSNTECLQGES